MRSVVVALVAAVLSAGAVRADGVSVDFNPKAAFDRYRTWEWAPGRDEGRNGVLADATMRQRVEKALTIRLRETGLKRADGSAAPDLLVVYRGDMGQGKDVAKPLYNYTAQTATLLVDLVDAATNTLAWRLYIDEKIKGANDPANKFDKSLDKGFAKYPPSPSEIKRKARELGISLPK